jgi:hypothetical protein
MKHEERKKGLVVEEEKEEEGGGWRGTRKEREETLVGKALTEERRQLPEGGRTHYCPAYSPRPLNTGSKD